MTKRKILLVAMALCMVAILAVGGSLAYLTDDEQAHNTMVIGNVRINIDEFTYLDGKWAKFENDTFTVYPMENEKGNAIKNKIVYTFNTSPSKDDVYIRTIILFEVNDLLPADYESEDTTCFPGLHFGFATNDTAKGSDGKTYTGSTNYKLAEPVTIDGEKYWVAVFTQKDGEAIPYDAALYTLASVWADKNITSEQMKGWGDKLDVIVFSQGIQATGLSHTEAMTALGEVNQTNLTTWLAGDDDAVINDWTTRTN